MQQNLFRAFCVIATGIFAQMTSCAMRYDIIYHLFAINSQYLKTLGVDSPTEFGSINS